MNEQTFEKPQERDDFLEMRNTLSQMLISDIDNEIIKTTDSQAQPWSAGFRNKLQIINLCLESFLRSTVIKEEDYQKFISQIKNLEKSLEQKTYTSEDPERLGLIEDLRILGAEILHNANH